MPGLTCSWWLRDTAIVGAVSCAIGRLGILPFDLSGEAAQGVIVCPVFSRPCTHAVLQSLISVTSGPDCSIAYVVIDQ
jgi:hypothetical protein